jgi:hypothetical protein
MTPLVPTGRTWSSSHVVPFVSFQRSLNNRETSQTLIYFTFSQDRKRLLCSRRSAWHSYLMFGSPRVSASGPVNLSCFGLSLSDFTCRFDIYLKITIKSKSKSKAILVTGRGGRWDCETIMIPYFLDSRLTDGGEVVSLTRRPRFTPRKIPPCQSFNVTSPGNAVCFKKRFTMVLQMLLCGECCENVYT